MHPLISRPALLLPWLLASGSAFSQPTAAQNVCQATADAILKTAEREARADFWIAVANCLNDPDASFPECVQEAAAERDEAIAFAQEQHDARLDACALLGPGPYAPDLDPAEFTPQVTSQWFPLVPGRTMVYQSETDEGLETEEVTPLQELFELEDFLVRPVRDLVMLDGECLEDTTDWYAQRDDGDVWYFGEVAQNFEDGLLDNLDGSWRTGKDDAKPGILVQGCPEVDAVYRQEFLANEAEDLARVIRLDAEVTVTYGTFTGCLETEEWSPLEPGIFERKFYAPGIGLILELNLESGERNELVAILP